MRTSDQSPGQAPPRPGSAVQLADAFATLLEVPEDLLSRRTRANVVDAQARLGDGRCNVVVLGEFKRGKSTLVNALLGAPLLPTGIPPLTSVPTIVRKGDHDRLIVRFSDGHEEQHAPSMLAHYATEVENPHNERDVEITIIEAANELLDGGIQLVDTPGVGSVHLHNTGAAHAFVPRTDAALVVLSADQPLSAQEHELLEVTERVAGRVLVVLNRIDRLDASEVETATRFVEKAMSDLATEAPRILAVSARHGTGVDKLRSWIKGLPRVEGGAFEASELAARRVLAATAGEADSACQLELAALDLPLLRLDERADEFAGQILALAPAREAAAAALERGVATVLEEHVSRPLRSLAADSAPRLRSQLHQHADQCQSLSPRRLRTQLVQWVDEQVRAVVEEAGTRIEADIAGALADLNNRYAVHIDAVLSELATGVADMLGDRPAWATPTLDVHERPPVQYKLRDEEEALGAVVSAVRALVPGALGRRLVEAEQERRLEQMVDRHAGRLRVQITEQARSTARQYEERLNDVIEEASDGVSATLARARHELTGGAESVAARRDILIHTRVVCAGVLAATTPSRSPEATLTEPG